MRKVPEKIIVLAILLSFMVLAYWSRAVYSECRAEGHSGSYCMRIIF